ncbi:hypothetical protein FRX31_009814 [Thalictrum thalictroides]|uniref:Uncharacterized protein n=1 Tax=Thalictrum thalictroides TaxID=46969 RepID=A0A7J6WV50_THATH|nr:hypothetical protein FRX31_009814 [Thalictrum thalictroides]
MEMDVQHFTSKLYGHWYDPKVMSAVPAVQRANQEIQMKPVIEILEEASFNGWTDKKETYGRGASKEVASMQISNKYPSNGHSDDAVKNSTELSGSLVLCTNANYLATLVVQVELTGLLDTVQETGKDGGNVGSESPYLHTFLNRLNRSKFCTSR